MVRSCPTSETTHFRLTRPSWSPCDRLVQPPGPNPTAGSSRTLPNSPGRLLEHGPRYRRPCHRHAGVQQAASFVVSFMPAVGTMACNLYLQWSVGIQERGNGDQPRVCPSPEPEQLLCRRETACTSLVDMMVCGSSMPLSDSDIQYDLICQCSAGFQGYPRNRVCQPVLFLIHYSETPL